MDSAVVSMSRSGRRPMPDQPQAPEQRHHHGAPGHCQFDEEEVVERAPDATQWLGHDQQDVPSSSFEALTRNAGPFGSAETLR